MSWAMIAAGGITAAGTVGAAYIGKDGNGGGGGASYGAGGLNLPSYSTSPYYESTQKLLEPYGAGLMRGDIPEYYKGIGESGGETFEDMLRSVKGDVSKGVYEDMARRKTRGGLGSYAISKAMGGITPKLRWEDYTRALEGKRFLMGKGIGITEGVRGAGLTEAGQKNQFALAKSRMEMLESQYQTTREDQAKAAKNKMWSDILSSAIGTVGSAVGLTQEE